MSFNKCLHQARRALPKLTQCGSGIVSIPCTMADTGLLSSISPERRLHFPRAFHSSGPSLDLKSESIDTDSDEYKSYHLSHLYVSNLPSHATWYDVKEFIVQHVEPSILYVHLLKNQSGFSRQSAFIRFESHQEAQRALKSLQEVKWDENILSVRMKRIPTASHQESSNKDSSRLFVGNLPFKSTGEDLKRFMEFKQDGIKIDDVSFMYGSDGRPRGYAIVQLATPEDARRAKEMHDVHFMGRPLIVREDRERAPTTFSPQSHPDCFLYLYNINPKVTLPKLREWIDSSSCDTTRSQVKDVRLLQGKLSPEKNAVVGFTSKEFAQKALATWKGMELMGNLLEVRGNRLEPRKEPKLEDSSVDHPELQDEVDVILRRLESLK